ncbi:MAG: 30S ribosomal protein S6 [Deltaproteobacteria bacterium]|jgi:small subunit ribosomal protein S6|nr:30S ribosomal protein S6 [Deltaproteobacteria bacterium]
MYFRRYETFILLSPHLTSDQLTGFKAKVEDILAKGEGQIVRFEERGRQKLAYPVQKELFGHYVLYDYRAKSELSSELERNLKLDEQVFKFLTIVLDKNFNEKKYQDVLSAIANEASKRDREQSQAEASAAIDGSAGDSSAEGEGEDQYDDDIGEGPDFESGADDQETDSDVDPVGGLS